MGALPTTGPAWYNITTGLRHHYHHHHHQHSATTCEFASQSRCSAARHERQLSSSWLRRASVRGFIISLVWLVTPPQLLPLTSTANCATKDPTTCVIPRKEARAIAPGRRPWQKIGKLYIPHTTASACVDSQPCKVMELTLCSSVLMRSEQLDSIKTLFITIRMPSSRKIVNTCSGGAGKLIVSELTNPDTNKTHLVLVAERLSSNPHFETCFAAATEDSASFGSYFYNDRHIENLRGSGKLFGPWEGGMANNIGFCHQSGASTRPDGRSADDISLPDLVARPTADDTFEMEQRCLLYISVRGALRRPWRSATSCVPAAAQLAAAPHARGVPHLKTQGQYRLVPG